MAARISFWALILWSLYSGSTSGVGAELGWKPEKTWLFVVGTLSWKHSDRYGSFPVKLRRDAELVDFFRRGGVPETHIVYLQDRQATQAQIDSAFESLLRKLGTDDLLLVYYCGHGSKSKKGEDVYLASYDAGDDGVNGWSINSIPQTIGRHARCKQVLWFMDCCYSGHASQVLARQTGGPAYGCATSSSASELSTGHWTFSEALLDALRGAPYVDLNHDGSITLAEFAAHTSQDMSLAEEQLSTFNTTGGFDQQMVLSCAGSLSNPKIGERAKMAWGGDWYTVRVVGTEGAKLKIHYIGYENDEDVWVGSDKLKPIKPVQYEVASEVEVLWKKKWYPATVLKVKDGVHFIHYLDYDSNWDEWVSSKRIRARKT